MTGFAPDLGLRWWKAGYTDKRFALARMPFDSIGWVSRDVFTTTVNLPLEQLYALSFDFSRAHLEELLALMPEDLANKVGKELSPPFTESMFMEIPRVLADVSCLLGDPEMNGDEVYVPLIVQTLTAPSQLARLDIID